MSTQQSAQHPTTMCARSLDPVDMLGEYFCSSQDKRRTGLALTALRIIHEEQRRDSQRQPLWTVLRTQPLDQQADTLPHLHATLSADLFAKPLAQDCVKPSSIAHNCSPVSHDLILQPGGTTPIFLPCYQQIAFCKNNSPPLRQKNTVSLNHCN